MAKERKVYDFKSSGLKPEVQDKVSSPSGDPVPIGISTPLRLSSVRGTLFEMHTSLTKQIRDNFRNMLSTNRGERLMLCDYGANLKPLAYQLGTDDGDGAAIARITSATEKFMPYIALQTFEPIREESQDGTLVRSGVRVTYTVPQLGLPEQTVEIVIMSAG